MNEFSQWLLDKVNNHVKSGGTLLDIGAYHGDFTKLMLTTNKFENAILFEPNTTNLALLNSHFSKNNKVNIIPKAVGSEEGTVDFYCSADLATGSLLSYCETDASIHKTTVDKLTIDSLFQDKPITFIKIDTQGHDLDVIRGAKRTIEKQLPMLVVELIFVDLYQEQASPGQIIYELTHHFNYSLSGIFNEHYTEQGFLAFADAVFVPNQLIKVSDQFVPRAEAYLLQQENDMLKKACDERLNLINRLSDELHNKPKDKDLIKKSTIFSKIISCLNKN